MEIQEQWLIKLGRLEEFKGQFYDTSYKGVFQKLSLKKMVYTPGPSTISR